MIKVAELNQAKGVLLHQIDSSYFNSAMLKKYFLKKEKKSNEFLIVCKKSFEIFK